MELVECLAKHSLRRQKSRVHAVVFFSTLHILEINGSLMFFTQTYHRYPGMWSGILPSEPASEAETPKRN